MPANALTAQLLAWVAERPRSYCETMEAWRTTCPRLTIWEDAVSDGLGEVFEAGGEVQVAAEPGPVEALLDLCDLAA